MSPLTGSVLALLFVLAGSAIGMALGTRLPEHYQNSESQSVVKLAMGLVGTMAALVLGLLISSAKSFYDTQSVELTAVSAQVVVLDRVLAHYGEETREARLVLRRIIVDSLNRIWPQESNQSELIQNAISGETLLDEIGSLSPKNEKQSALKSQALNMAIALSGTRWLMSTQEDTTVPKPILMIVIFWLTAIFLSFSLFAPRNALVFASFLVAAFPGPSF